MTIATAPRMALLSAMFLTIPSIYAATPIAATGANQDIIVEGYNPGGDLTTYATSSFDVANGSTFLAKGIGFGGDPGLLQSFVSESDPSVEFELLGGYDELNTLQLINGTSGTLTMVTPSAYSEIYVLTASANGSATGTATVNFSGGSSLVLAFASGDWYGSDDVAISAGPVYAGTSGGTRAYYTNGNDAPAPPRLFQYELAIPLAYQGLEVTSIDFSIDSAGNDQLYTSIMGLSGNAVPEPSVAAMISALGLFGLVRRKRANV
ncbi:PEP-CTERM sorting domain-containing protein [Luteolibacter pohnpeiensis]|uniref:PEP-CTERM sorting domain-containing protein n=1 Tax=Luteolibacter pohnpeiensis TaxID=454153 RepID=A0A934VV40_9BACT|nr:PEP-CTERM sorting domain-containing protein [Luteolibacter pohnpeiensis]MBK1881149.1 PEP-CTERM sorting domain-containing protein [Luteolibacter pohnpeiensis]